MWSDQSQKKNKSIYRTHKPRARYFKDLIKQKRITSTEKARAACTFPEQLNHKPKDRKHDSSLQKWHFLDRKARLGNTSVPKKMDWLHLWGNRWNPQLERGFTRLWTWTPVGRFTPRTPWGRHHRPRALLGPSEQGLMGRLTIYLSLFLSFWIGLY